MLWRIRLTLNLHVVLKSESAEVSWPAVLFSVGQDKLGEIQEFHLKKNQYGHKYISKWVRKQLIPYSLKPEPAGWTTWRRMRCPRTYQALVDEVLSEVDQSQREHKFQQALLTEKNISVTDKNTQILTSEGWSWLTLSMCSFSVKVRGPLPSEADRGKEHIVIH